MAGVSERNDEINELVSVGMSSWLETQMTNSVCSREWFHVLSGRISIKPESVLN